MAYRQQDESMDLKGLIQKAISLTEAARPRKTMGTLHMVPVQHTNEKGERVHYKDPILAKNQKEAEAKALSQAIASGKKDPKTNFSPPQKKGYKGYLLDFEHTVPHISLGPQTHSDTLELKGVSQKHVTEKAHALAQEGGLHNFKVTKVTRAL